MSAFASSHRIATAPLRFSVTTSSANPAASPTAVVLSPVHVSCFITAANRATPVFEVVPDRHCVRVVTKPQGDHTPAAASSTPGLIANVSSSGGAGANAAPNAEWDFHTLFASSAASHASDFYHDVTQPAFQHVCDGWNTNIVAWGVHPTQKYRLLFGKSTSVSSSNHVANHHHADINHNEVLELYGQVGGLLSEFFAPVRFQQQQQQSSSMAARGWRVGISSWIVVNNKVIDLLEPALTASTSSSSTTHLARSTAAAPAGRDGSTQSTPPLSFVSLEATTFASACRILQVAKTNRIVLKQNAEHAHFFVRLAFFYNGQVSTLHVVDLVDLRDFCDAVSTNEKIELMDMLHELQQPVPLSPSPRHSMASPLRTARGSSRSSSSDMVLLNFMRPLLTANAKTFLYANVIDSRASLRDSVQLLNAVANVKNFACACKRLCGVDFTQLGFQTLPEGNDELLDSKRMTLDSNATLSTTTASSSVHDVAAKAMAAVAVGESLLSRLASAPSLTLSSSSTVPALALQPPDRSMSLGSIAALSSPSPLLESFMHPTDPSFASIPDLSSILSSSSIHSLSYVSAAMEQQSTQQPIDRRDSLSAVPLASETLTWLDSFSQRKREILGARIDTVAPLPAAAALQRDRWTASTSAAAAKMVWIGPDGLHESSSYNRHSNKSSNSSSDDNLQQNARSAAFSAQLTATAASTLNFDATHTESAERSSVMAAQTSADLLERLRGAMATRERSAVRRTNSEPLPITDDDDNNGIDSRGELLDAYAAAPGATTVPLYSSRIEQHPVPHGEQANERWPESMSISSSHEAHARHHQHAMHDDNSARPAPSTLYHTSTTKPSKRDVFASSPTTTDLQSLDRNHHAVSGCASQDTGPADTSTPTLSRPAMPAAVNSHPNTSPMPLSSTDRRNANGRRSSNQLLSEALEHANVPTRAMVPAKVDGLDATTVNKIQAAEAALLRKNYDALLAIVQEQTQLRDAADARAAEATHERDEVRASLEVQIENMKLQNVTLRRKVRALESQSSLPNVFAQYEQELQALLTEVQQLRARNVALELKMVDSDSICGSSAGSVHDLKKKYQAVVDSKQQLEKQLLEYRKRERQFMVQSKLVGDSTRRVDQLARELTNKDEALVATQLGKLRVHAERHQVQEHADELHRANEKLLVENAATTEELLATKMYLASLENEQRKADILDKFVQKHGDRMHHHLRRGDAPSSSTSSWRRDAAARACEDKVFATVKRSLPQLVPLVNKLLRRLEMQELALREFSEREVDFIHLLVELVSDQPAVSLKHMIAREMQRLPN